MTLPALERVWKIIPRIRSRNFSFSSWYIWSFEVSPAGSYALSIRRSWHFLPFRVYQRISNHSFPPFIHITWHILFVNICLLGHILRKAFSDILCLRSISIPLVQVPERVWKIFPTNVSYRFISARYMLPACHAHTHRYVMGVLRQMKHVCKKDTLLSKGTLSPEKDTSW